ncbi:xanthine dehydrogenase-like isoform X1 [Photinus pyralis]|uniref:xanthine dehydrogenase-like isoform X1 n=1 Tax=Photinus pyralis TaxID=7054 RepID=UPI001266E810|nr:xanthine dehydrogenase-like isoform X1 [Photinus pyralis]
MSLPLVFFVNGKKVVEEDPDPDWTLLYYLRSKLMLCGTKLGCGEGGCGACTVMISKYDREKNKVGHLAINACLAPVCSMHGLAVTTVEGIGSTKTKIHPVQERMAKSHGSQCGFCTPGIVMSMYTLLRNSPLPKMKDLEKTFQGNLCRCTGYRPIIEGFKTFTEDYEVMQTESLIVNGKCRMGDQCCKQSNGWDLNGDSEIDKLIPTNVFTPYDPSQEPIFPPELKMYDTLDTQNLTFKSVEVTWFRPIALEDLLKLKSKHPKAKIVNGNTEIGVEIKYKHQHYPIRVHASHIPELCHVKIETTGIVFGSAVTLTNATNVLMEQIRTRPPYQTGIFSALVEMLHWFAGQQIRNVASIGGNIITGSPISDLVPILIASEAVLEVKSVRGVRQIVMNENFYSSYRTTILNDDEVLVSIIVPCTKENQFFCSYKQARRRDDDTAIVNFAINVTFKENTIETIKMVFGGMGATVQVPSKTCKALVGRPWNQETLDEALDTLIEDLPLSPNAPGGMTQYRRSLTLSLMFKAYLEISNKLDNTKVNPRDLSAIEPYQYNIPKSSQLFSISPQNLKTRIVGHPIPHVSAIQQSTGEAIYCDDIPEYKNELHLGLVLSTKAHATFTMDPADALKMKGVHLFLSAKDCSTGKVFVEKIVTSQGQMLGAIVAETKSLAQKAARMVRVTYHELRPVIITIEDAIKHNSYFTDVPSVIETGNVTEAFAVAPHVIEGECRSGAQEHFYLETQSALVVPKDGNELEVFSATQAPHFVSKMIGDVLQIPQHKINVRVKRLGGGFGGKGRPSVLFAVPVALAAYRLGRPVRCMLDRDEDMLITGSRHPFYIKYSTAFDDQGKILACEIYMYNNAGYSKDTSDLVMQRALFHFQNAYKLPNVRAHGYLCKTNLPSNGAMRGFGAPQGMLAGEFMVRKIAEFLGKDPLEVTELNMYRAGDSTHYKQKIENCTVDRCWTECIANSNYYQRKLNVQKFNRENRWKKRGIAVVPTMYGVGYGYGRPTFQQAGSLVNVYTDGSVLLTHGGVEMGQGLHTKMIQVASTVLEINYNKIHISEISTATVPNAVPTASSISADLNGMAVLYACEEIKSRLEPFKLANPKGKWEDWVTAAYTNRVNLSATGYYKIPITSFDSTTQTGTFYNYYSAGAACTEVEIDCLSGDHRILKTDIVMDVGDSLNPAVDIGQIEGAFMQGYGLYTLEEMMYAPDGTTLTKGPGTYKLPSFTNIPTEFNVALLKGAPNPKAIYSSKAIGEPPLFLASSVLFAIREAIKSSREDAGVPVTDFTLFPPATSAKIRMACEDILTMKLDKPEPGSFIPWNVDV